jgi:RimJ/RimL family protein N-acetyltransferase
MGFADPLGRLPTCGASEHAGQAGFAEEGRYRESAQHDGHWYDEVLMSILDHEWAARRSPGR